MRYAAKLFLRLIVGFALLTARTCAVRSRSSPHDGIYRHGTNTGRLQPLFAAARLARLALEIKSANEMAYIRACAYSLFALGLPADFTAGDRST